MKTFLTEPISESVMIFKVLQCEAGFAVAMLDTFWSILILF